jgi:hypothetical protein
VRDHLDHLDLLLYMFLDLSCCEIFIFMPLTTGMSQGDWVAEAY